MEKSINIYGMSCAGCAKRLEDEVSKLEGIEKANVNFANETLYIQYNNKLDKKNLFKNIEKLGFKYLDNDNIKEVIIGIGGMSCVGCAKGIEKLVVLME